jgi:hypothetical protein
MTLRYKIRREKARCLLRELETAGVIGRIISRRSEERSVKSEELGELIVL